MAFPKAVEGLVQFLQEASTAMGHSEVRDKLQQAVRDAHKGSGEWAGYVDHTGDGSSGDCIFSGEEGMQCAPYSISSEGGKSSSKVDITKAKKVTPSVSYKPVAESAANDESNVEAAAVEITGDCIPLREGAVGQDGTAYLKLIQPGWGSCGYYPAEVLERDGPAIFQKGTKNFWNHQTAAEEAARPEGDLRDLASVLTENAHYEKAGPAGAGLYARAKVFENFRQPVDDLAKHIGVSIRANGKAKQGTAPDGRKGAIIESLTSALSADYVTTPGAGGAVLQLFEAARKRPAETTNTGDVDMTEAEARKLQESNQTLASELRKLKERAAKTDAAGVIADYFKTVRVGEAVQIEVQKTLLERVLPLTAAGDLDAAALTKLAEAETVRELEFIEKATGHKIVRNMGGAAGDTLTEAQKAEIKARETVESESFVSIFEFAKKQEAGRKIMREGRAAFDPYYNAGDGHLVLVGAEDK